MYKILHKDETGKHLAHRRGGRTWNIARKTIVWFIAPIWSKFSKAKQCNHNRTLTRLNKANPKATFIYVR